MEDKSLTADAKSLARQLNMLGLTIDPKCNMPERHEVNTEKRDVRLRTSGFLASKTIGVDMTPLEAMDNYGMRDEQEKCLQLQKGPSGQDRTRCWSESSKHGRMFICFIGLILASYVRSVWGSERPSTLQVRIHRIAAGRDAHHPVHRAPGQDETYDPLCGWAGRDLQGFRL